MTDARGRLDSDPFDFRVTKSGTVFITRGGRTVMELGGARAAGLLRSLERAEDATAEQLLLAKITGHYKH